MLTYTNKDEITSKQLLKSEVVQKFLSIKDEKTFNSMADIIFGHLENRGDKAINNNESSYTIFGILLGHKGLLPDKEHNYIWDLAHEVFGDTDFAKRFLGTVQMYSFSLSKHHWIVVVDDYKDEKLKKGEIPIANQFFLHNRGATSFAESLEFLKKKFNK